MCGIAGILDRDQRRPPARDELAAMAALVEHRGPDGFGLLVDPPVGLAHARLAIIDLAGGDQPLANEDGSVWVTYNGEIYNYLELREELAARGHAFRTRSDTEVLVHAYEEWGLDLFERLNGNFAFGLWDRRTRRLVLGRDRLGIRPLFWTEQDGRLLFASEMKSLVGAGVEPAWDPRGLDQVFTLWTTVAPRTVLAGVHELPPGSMLVVEPGQAPRVRMYWDLPAPPRDGAIDDEQAAVDALRELLADSIRLRLRADVPVGAYLSGGLDSTAATALVRTLTDTPLETYSITFTDRDYDESAEQRIAAEALGTTHHAVPVDYESIAGALEQVVGFAEKPFLRTAPVPLFLLSGLVHDHGCKVVLTGEGADEVFGGYDLFKETKIRAWWARRPDSRLRPALLRRLYPFAPGAEGRAWAFFEAFYREGIDEPDDPGFSHRPTWRNGRRNRVFFSRELAGRLAEYDAPADVLAAFREPLAARDPLGRAEYIEFKVFLAGHLLASQGDRMSMGHSVEGRYPFLDHRIVEFGQALDPRLKLFGLREKWILRRAVADLLPESILWRHKRPYIAPNVRPFVDGAGARLVDELLATGELEAGGLFDPARVRALVAKSRSGRPLGERETMAFVGIVTAGLLPRCWRRWKSIAAQARRDAGRFPLRPVLTG
ncbi:MAG: asparagine synthase (glutamine-hydrolyzing) [Acidobacteria bacterium]|nr:MAG: asparagine synthase (glutamine-hydrolyzing) [Acidobacteriota bacterium]